MSKILFSSREDKIYIFKPPCNFYRVKVTGSSLFVFKLSAIIKMYNKLIKTSACADILSQCYLQVDEPIKNDNHNNDDDNKVLKLVSICSRLNIFHSDFQEKTKNAPTTSTLISTIPKSTKLLLKSNRAFVVI